MGHEDVTTTLSIYTGVPADYIDRVDGVLVDSLLPGEENERHPGCCTPLLYRSAGGRAAKQAAKSVVVVAAATEVSARGGGVAAERACLGELVSE